MTEIYLISPDFIREQTNVSSNIQDKFLESAIREAQNINYKELIGNKLLDKLLDLVSTGEIKQEENKLYNELIDKSLYYIAYNVIARLTIISGIKIDNIGPSSTYDENVNPVGINDLFRLEKHYIHIADTYGARIQDFIKANKEFFKPYIKHTCYDMDANLDSSSSCGIYLGGERGKLKTKKQKYIYV